MRYTSTTLLLIGFLFVSFTSIAPTTPESASAANDNDLIQQVIELTNARRVAEDLPPLKFEVHLHAAAMWLAQDMAENDYVAHEDAEGRDILQRLPSFGYTPPRLVAENVAAGQPDPEQVLQEWLQSPGHRRNILNPQVREIGVGYFFQLDDNANVRIADATAGPFGHYWVQDFGSRHNVYPVIINNEASSTDSAEVELYIYGEEWASEMSLSNDGTTWSEWEAFQPNRTWTLAPGSEGTRTVYVKLREAETNAILQHSDSIELTEASEAPPVEVPAASSQTVYLPLVQRSASAQQVVDNTLQPQPTQTPEPAPQPTQTPEPAPQPDAACLSAEENQLASAINDYRAANGLPPVAVAPSLMRVAHAHVQDLHHNTPNVGTCNLHSWSNQGTWSPVCYTDDHSQAEGMWNKPREISNGAYNDNGFEIAYFTSGQASAAAALNTWQHSSGHSEVILQQGMWQRFEWSAMGIGISENYAVVWFGASPDSAGAAGQCQ